MERGALGRHFEVLKWLRANGCKWDVFTCCRLDERTCSAAAEEGHLEVLKWRWQMAVIGTRASAVKRQKEGTSRSCHRPEVAEEEWLCVGRRDMRGIGERRPPRGPQVGQGE